ncbi:hypothetical protein DENSPDRAFT_885904 [Dentipellis sp. KUC8613]|nr:hypothetical protein DENSPDRAFT_885904 [Dentipellis sp. KUC8613]
MARDTSERQHETLSGPVTPSSCPVGRVASRQAVLRPRALRVPSHLFCTRAGSAPFRPLRPRTPAPAVVRRRGAVWHCCQAPTCRPHGLSPAVARRRPPSPAIAPCRPRGGCRTCRAPLLGRKRAWSAVARAHEGVRGGTKACGGGATRRC